VPGEPYLVLGPGQWALEVRLTEDLVGCGRHGDELAVQEATHAVGGGPRVRPRPLLLTALG
jgi:hypothetical protein